MSALTGLLRKEAYHILRDRRTLAVIVLLPVVQVVLFGFAIRTDVRDVRIIVVDPLPDATTLSLRARLAASGVFRVVTVLPGADELDGIFQRGEATEAIVFEPRFGERLAQGLPARIQLITDGTDPNSASVRQNYAMALIGAWDRERSPARGAVRIEPRTRLRFNPTAESSNLFVPGLMAFVLTIISSLMTAISLTREKESGTMEALLVSPLRPWQIIGGKVAPYLAIGLVSMTAIVVEARLVFHVPLRGSYLLLLAEGLLFILVSLALGMLISARTSSQRVAMLGALVGTMLPTLLLSGFIFPIESMPRLLRWVSYIVPARWFVTIARGIMLKGIGIVYLWEPTLILIGMAAVLLTLAVRSFDVRLE